jgi:DNA-binding transcriptional LysR family regulator
VDAVARHGSIRKAAEALNVAPSALNRQILDLETDLGSALFERLPRGMRPTAAGEIFLAYTRQAISELKTVASQVEELRGLVRGQVNVAAVESVVGDLLPSAIAQFQTAHPNVRFFALSKGSFVVSTTTYARIAVRKTLTNRSTSASSL